MFMKLANIAFLVVLAAILVCTILFSDGHVVHGPVIIKGYRRV